MPVPATPSGAYGIREMTASGLPGTNQEDLYPNRGKSYCGKMQPGY